MADRYIDQDEVSIYGSYSSKQIRARVVGLLPVFDPALNHIADQIDANTAAVEGAVAIARDTDAQTRKGSHQKSPLLADAFDLIGRFSKHLDSHKANTIDRKLFFTKDGTIAGIGRGANDVFLAVNWITSKLAEPDNAVNSRAEWHQEFLNMGVLLGPALAFSSDARTDRRSQTPEIRAAREAFLNVYQAAKAQVECVLRLTGKLHLMSSIFYDLAVPGQSKTTAAPAEDETDGNKPGEK